MKAYLKKAAVLASTVALAAGSLVGCSGSVDGTRTAATVNGEELKVGTVSFWTRYQQAQTTQLYEMYFGGMQAGVWDSVADEETGETYGEQTVNDVVDQMEDMMILRQHAEEYDVALTDEQKTAIQEAAAAFMEANDDTTIARLGVSQEHIEEALELSTYETLMFDPMVADVDLEVSDEEAAQTGITYVEVAADSSVDSDSGEDSGEETTESDEELQAKAQQILDEALNTEDADLNTIAQGIDENLSATETTFTTNPQEDTESEDADAEDSEEEEDTTYDESVPQELQDAAKELQDGEIYDKLIEVDGTYYVLRLDAAFDEEATETEKETIQSDRQQAAYDEILEGWRDEAEIKEETKNIEKIRVRDNDTYTIKQDETEDVDSGESVDSDSGEVTLDSDSGEVIDSGEVEDTTTEDGAAEDTEATEDGAAE